MPIFRYEAIDKQGQTRRGAMEAPSEEVVRHKLSLMGFHAQAVALPGQPASTAASPPAQSVAATQPQAPRASAGFITSSLSVKDQALFWRQLSEMAVAGVSAFDMFNTIGQRASNRHVRRAALDVSERVRSGQSVADAMSANGDVFGTDTRIAILAGELGGFAYEVYGDLAREYEDELQHRNRWRWFRWYYKFMLVGTIFALTVLIAMMNQIGDLKHIMDTAGQSSYSGYILDGIRKGVYHFFRVVGPLTFLIMLGVPALMSWMEQGPLRPFADAATYAIPGIRQFKRTRLMMRFYRMLRRLTAAGVAPMVAWDAAANATGHHVVSEKLAIGKSYLASGMGFGPALQATHMAPNGDIAMLTTADKTGRVPEMLGTLERDYESRWGSSSKLVKVASSIMIGIVYGALVVYFCYRLFSWWYGLPMQVDDVFK